MGIRSLPVGIPTPSRDDLAAWLAPTWSGKRWTCADAAGVLYWRFYGRPRRTQAHLAREHGVSQSRIEQIERAALYRLSLDPSWVLCDPELAPDDPLRRVLRGRRGGRAGWP